MANSVISGSKAPRCANTDFRTFPTDNGLPLAHNTPLTDFQGKRRLSRELHLEGKPLARSWRFAERQREYEEALLEPDEKLVPGRVAIAEAAILKRFRMLSKRPEHKEESAAISDALNNLRIFSRE